MVGDGKGNQDAEPGETACSDDPQERTVGVQAHEERHHQQRFRDSNCETYDDVERSELQMS